MNASNVASMLRRHGRAITLKRRPLPSGTVVDTPAVSAKRNANQKRWDGVTVLTSDAEEMVAAAGLSVVPEPSEYSVVVGGVERAVVAVRVFEDRSGSPIAYNLLVRL